MFINHPEHKKKTIHCLWGKEPGLRCKSNQLLPLAQWDSMANEELWPVTLFLDIHLMLPFQGLPLVYGLWCKGSKPGGTACMLGTQLRSCLTSHLPHLLALIPTC